MNDINDSNTNRELVIETASKYNDVFYNTAIPKLNFPGPVVLTVNPAKKTDKEAVLVDPIPKNLMYVRVRTNMWNIDNVVRPAIEHYTKQGVPVVLTFMAYYDTADTMPESCKIAYEYRKRTLNSYWAIKFEYWKWIMDQFVENALVHSCGREDIKDGSKCRNCGNCIREYFSTRERIR